jgi:hypothetical protein
VIRITKENAYELSQNTGIEPTLTDDEIKHYVDHALEEVKRKMM